MSDWPILPGRSDAFYSDDEAIQRQQAVSGKRKALVLEWKINDN